jgi:hypothetical protein
LTNAFTNEVMNKQRLKQANKQELKNISIFIKYYVITKKMSKLIFSTSCLSGREQQSFISKLIIVNKL